MLKNFSMSSIISSFSSGSLTKVNKLSSGEILFSVIEFACAFSSCTAMDVWLCCSRVNFLQIVANISKIIHGIVGETVKTPVHYLPFISANSFFTCLHELHVLGISINGRGFATFSAAGSALSETIYCYQNQIGWY